MTQSLGVILAGGLATRMGGGDKTLRDLQGRPILAHVIERLRPQVAGMALNANGDPARFAEWDLPVIPDSIDGFAGPLAGVLAGLDWAADQGATQIVTVAADTPFFPSDLTGRLVAGAEAQGVSIALAATPEGDRINRHPTFGLWPVTLRDDLRAALNDGLRKVVLWTDRHGAATVPFPHRPLRSVLQHQHTRRPRPSRGDGMKIWGITGWKNSGKTGLMERLVTEFTGRGHTVSTLKHAHHAFDVDQPGKDSFRHRQAGASEVLLSSRKRWALMHELRNNDEPTLEDLLAKLSPVDLILVEGFKTGPHPKIEAHRPETGQPLIAPRDPSIRAVASTITPDTGGVPLLPLDDTSAIADFISAELDL